MNEEKEQICPKCGSNNVSVEVTQETNDTSVIMGSFAPPFHMFCHDCNHKWYLVNEDDSEKEDGKTEKKTQRRNGALIVLLGYIIPLILFFVFILLIRKYL